ncbi:MAG: hypothetical protein AAB685_00840, partial [Patescibacteria group bacterium]
MKEDLVKKLRKLNFVIVSHVLVTGPAIELEEFLKDKVNSLIFIGHPFGFRKDIRSFYRLYASGDLEEEKFTYPWKFPQILTFIKEAIYTLMWILTTKEKWNIYIGSDNYSAYLGILLKKLGKVKDVILYTIDYVPNRFGNPFLNFLYRYFDRACLRKCKVIWNVSDRIIEAREKYERVSREDSVAQITVPLGIWYDRIPKVPLAERDNNTLVFLGTVLEKQGLEIVIKALPVIFQKLPEVK